MKKRNTVIAAAFIASAAVLITATFFICKKLSDKKYFTVTE